MATQFPGAGAILRRGTAGLNPEHLKFLVENADKVQEILDKIEQERAGYIELRQSVEKASAELAEAAEANEAAVDALTDAQVAFDQEKTDWHAKSQETETNLANWEAGLLARDEVQDQRRAELDALKEQLEKEADARSEGILADTELLDQRTAQLHAWTDQLEAREAATAAYSEQIQAFAERVTAVIAAQPLAPSEGDDA